MNPVNRPPRPTEPPEQPDPPRYVLTSTGQATAVLRRLTRAGWHTREGFALTEPTWDVHTARLALFGRVTDVDTLRLVVLASARGAAVVAVTDPTGPIGRALLADLSRLGPVQQEPDTQPQSTDPGPAVRRLIPEQRALLRRLANGETIAAAAAAEFLSLRTANRRIAAARDVLGVRTTREAVLAYLQERNRP